MKSYPALMMFFGEEGDSDRDTTGTARGLYIHLKTYRYIFCFVFTKGYLTYR